MKKILALAVAAALLLSSVAAAVDDGAAKILSDDTVNTISGYAVRDNSDDAAQDDSDDAAQDDSDDAAQDDDSDDAAQDDDSDDAAQDDDSDDAAQDDDSDDTAQDDDSDDTAQDDDSDDTAQDDSNKTTTSTMDIAEQAAEELKGHWAEKYILALNKLEIIKPSASDRSYQPDESLTRAEFMRYINRAFDFTETTDINFTDVQEEDWYYETVQIACNYGYINGMGNNRMDPEGTLTREQAATIIGRLHKYTPTGDRDSLPFSDKADIGDWSVGYIADAVEKGYIDGFTDGTFQPQGLVTRAQVAKILYFFMGTSLNTTDTWYVEDDLTEDTQNVSISVPCSFSDATVKGDLYITEGVGDGDVSLTNVTVEGNLIISGGEVMLDGVGAKRVIVSNPLGMQLDITCIGNSNLAQTEVQTAARLTENSLTVSASGFSDLSLTGKNLNLTLDGHFWTVSAEETASILTSGSTEVNTLVANARTTVTGGGTITSAVFNVSGCDLIMQPGSYELANGVSVTLAGEAAVAENNISVIPSTLNVNLGDSSSLALSYEFTYNAENEDLLQVLYGEQELEQGNDYTLLSNKNGISLSRRFLTSLKTNSCILQLIFRNGDKGQITISSQSASVGMVSPNTLFIDRYTQSPNYIDQVLTLTLPTGTQLKDVKLSSMILERGKDYTYNNATGEMLLMRETLAQKTTGTYTISFTLTQGSSFTCTLTVTDTSPKNEVSPTELDFDANVISGAYADLSVTLNAVNGATLKSISCGSKTLEEDWQYRIEGDTVILNKSAIASFASNRTEYADFTFVMSSGKSPVLRVNYVTTVSLSATVLDGLGQPISNVPVTFAPADSDGSPAQTVTTDENGIARVYAKHASYIVSASDSRFTGSVTESLKTTSSRSVELVAEMLESVTITVTNNFGAKLSGAVVTIGGQSVTTGADGAATFTIKRANYTVQVSCSGYQTKSQPLTVNQPIQARIILD